MFTAFNLTMDEKEMARLEKGAPCSDADESVNQAKVVEELKKYLGMGAAFDGEALLSEWFPELKFQVFLSHALADEPLALSAGFRKSWEFQSLWIRGSGRQQTSW